MVVHLGQVLIPRSLVEGQGQLGEIEYFDCWTLNSFAMTNKYDH